MNKPQFPDLPNITENTALPPFKAWVQFAIPTVFDDSLSYYELLSKVIEYLNVTNEHLTNVDENFSANNEVFVETYNKIVTWFNDLDVNAEINAKVQSILDTWAQDGTFDTILTTLFHADIIDKTVETTNTWLEDNLDPSTGYVLDDSLTVENAAPKSSIVGNAIKNTLGSMFDTVSNRFIPNSGYYTTADPVSNALLYQFIELDKSKNTLIIYPKIPISECCITISITSSKSINPSAYIRHIMQGNLFASGGAQYVSVNAPIVVSYDSNNNENYARVSIALPNNLSTTNDRDLLYFAFNNDIVSRIMNNSIDNVGNIQGYSAILNRRITAEGGTSAVENNSLLYQYIELPKQDNSIKILSSITGLIRCVITNARSISASAIVGIFDTTGNELVVPYDYTDHDVLYLRASIQTITNLSPETDKNTLTFLFNKGAINLLNEKVYDLLYGDVQRESLVACPKRYVTFGTLTNTPPTGYGITNIKDMGYNTFAFVSVNNDNIEAVKTFVSYNSGTDILYPLPIRNGEAYVFSKIPVFYYKTSGTEGRVYDLNKLVIQNLTTGETVVGYLNNGTNFSITWNSLSGGGNDIQNIYNNTINQYTNEFTGDITVNPTITTDTNNFLASSGDTTDRSADILAMLQTGSCILGNGKFYVSNVVMPAGTHLSGQGNSTEIIWINNPSNTLIQMQSNCTISSLRINANGASGDVSPFYASGDTIIDRKDIPAFSAILFSGETGNNYCNIHDVTIHNCAGSAINTNTTGTSPRKRLLVNNCNIHHCTCGINNGVESEFHKISNTTVHQCYYGIITNGGNIGYTNCNISYCHYSILVTGTGDNHAHGIYNGCFVVHSTDVYGQPVVTTSGVTVDKGYILVVEGVTEGEKFIGCNFGFGVVQIDGSQGIKFPSCGFGNINCDITTSSGIIFDGVNVVSAGSVNFTKDSVSANVRYIDCFTKNGSVWTPD